MLASVARTFLPSPGLLYCEEERWEWQLITVQKSNLFTVLSSDTDREIEYISVIIIII